MNYLAHLYFSDPGTDAKIGNLLGDFVRGPIPAQYPLAVRKGVWLHRKIDAFTDLHPCFLRSKARLSSDRRRLAGIILDIAFDHYLINHWQLFSNVELNDFIETSYKELNSYSGELPEQMNRVVSAMTTQDWLSSYIQLEGVSMALDRVSRRFRRPTKLYGSGVELQQNYLQLEQDFLEFFPQLIAYVAELKCSDAYTGDSI